MTTAVAASSADVTADVTGVTIAMGVVGVMWVSEGSSRAGVSPATTEEWAGIGGGGYRADIAGEFSKVGDRRIAGGETIYKQVMAVL